MDVQRCTCGAPVYLHDPICLTCGAERTPRRGAAEPDRPKPAHDGQGARYADEPHVDASRRA